MPHRTFSLKPFSEIQPHRGAAVILTLVVLVVLIGFAALTIDVGNLYNIRAELQNTADAAALAATQALPDQAQARLLAVQYADLNNFRYGSVVDVSGVDLGHWDFSGGVFTLGGVPVNAVHVLAHRSNSHNNPVSLFLAPVLGRATTEVCASATAAYGRAERWDVVIVQDVTGSFADEIDEARIADQALLDCIREHAPGTLLGLVTFTGYGAILAPLKSVEDDYGSLSATIGQIDTCGSAGMPPCSGTNIGAGLDSAIDAFTAVPPGDRPRAIILVSDGMPNSSLPGYTDADLAAWAVDSADAAGASGISVFTLFYSGNDATPGAADFLGGLVRGDGKAHETPDPDEMETELQEICREGMIFMLVQ